MTAGIAFTTLRASPLFDGVYYAKQSGVPSGNSAALIEHYLDSGVRQGLNPHPLFDSSYYLAQYPDVADANVNPLVHYILHGAFEGRNPNPFFDSRSYIGATPELNQNRAINPLQHYWAKSTRLKGNPHELFDPLYYINCYPEVLLEGMEPLEHYLNIGYKQMRRAFIDFDRAFYLAAYPDVAVADIDPKVHFNRFGRDEGRLPRKPMPAALNESLLSAWSEQRGRQTTGRRTSVYWGNPMTTSAQFSLFKEVLAKLPQVEFCTHNALLPDASFTAQNLTLLPFDFSDEQFFGDCGIFINSSMDAPISELMLAAALAGLLIVSPTASDISQLLQPQQSCQIPCEVLLPGMIVHAITYSTVNREDTLHRIRLANQRLLVLKVVTDTSQ